jgi:hypothetical protein
MLLRIWWMTRRFVRSLLLLFGASVASTAVGQYAGFNEAEMTALIGGAFIGCVIGDAFGSGWISREPELVTNEEDHS